MDEATQFFSQLWIWAKGWRAEAAAAWAQAILSALAIWYSGRLAFRQARAAKADQIDTYVEMLHVACRSADIAKQVSEDLERHKTSLLSNGQGFSRLGASFQAIPFHEMPDHRLVAIVQGASNACDELDRHYDYRMKKALPFGLPEVIAVQAAHRVLNEYREEAEGISNEMMSTAEKFRFAAWRAQTTMRNLLKLRHRNSSRSHED